MIPFSPRFALQFSSPSKKGAALPAESPGFVAELARKYSKRLKRFIFTRSRNRTDVADLAQEVFLRLLRNDHQSAIRSPEAYLFTIASHVVHQNNLEQIRSPATIDIGDLYGELQLISPHDPTFEVDLQQRVAELERALQSVPAKVRVTLLLHRYAGYSIEEIARQIGVSRPTAKRYLAAGLAHCRHLRMEP
jgi:RNA polymerase sigma-70 factor (ECF subfamily)